jgi:DNA-binding NarL/FixJ family response regulator
LFSLPTILQQAIKSYPQTAVVVTSQEQDVHLVSNLAEVGVKGYFLKSDNFTETLGVIVQQIYEGGGYFSPIVVKIIEAAPQLKQDLPLSNAEMNVLRALLRWPELSRKAQAEMLCIIPSTLQKHIKSILTKLNAPNVESCLVKAMRMGMVYKGETIEEPLEHND